MANINLYQDDQEEKVIKPKAIDTGLIVAVVVFLIILAGYLGVEFYLRSLDKKIAASQAEEVNAKNLLNGEDVDLAASFQQRMDILEAQKEAFAQNNPDKFFLEVQKSMIKGVVASSLNLQGKAVKLSLIADDFEVLARQIANFKNNSAFQNVEVKSSARNEQGKVSADLSMNLIL